MAKNKHPNKRMQFHFLINNVPNGAPWWLSGKESACQCRRQVQTGGWEDPLEEEMATHSSILASFKFWEIPWTEEREGLWSIGSRKSQTQQSD